MKKYITMKPELTERQAQTLNFIIESFEQNFKSPTLKEIGEHLGTVGYRAAALKVAALERKGYLTRKVGYPRSIIVIKDVVGNSVHRYLVEGIITDVKRSYGDTVLTVQVDDIELRAKLKQKCKIQLIAEVQD